MSRKNDWPLLEACALVVDICAGQLEQPNILASTIATCCKMYDNYLHKC